MVIQIFGLIFFVLVPVIFAAEVLRCVYLEYRKDRIPIILYHRLISKEAAVQGLVPDDEMIYVSYDTVFAEQMEYLHKGDYTTIDFDDYLKIRSGQCDLPSKPVLITFDDGYLSNYTMAFPALKKYGQKAVIFVALQPDDYTVEKVKGFDGFVNEEQIREMADNNISIQSHTLTHCQLTDFDNEQAEYELTESRRRLESITGRSVEHIAIPRASYNRRIRNLVKDTGYKTACCNNKGSSNGLSDPLALPRIVIERDMSIKDFANCLMPKTSAILRIIGNIKRIPERIGGHKFAGIVRNLLYKGPLQKLFETRNLKVFIATLALLYIIASIFFALHLISTWLSMGGN